MDDTGNEVIQSALSKAAIKLRASLQEGNEVLSPNATPAIEIDPILGEYFGLDTPDAHMATKVEEISAWLREMGYTDGTRLDALRAIELRLGDNNNPNRLDKIAHYVKLRIKSRLFSKQADAMMK